MARQHVSQQRGADAVRRIESTQFAQQQARLFQVAQTQVQIRQTFEREQIKTHGCVKAHSLVAERRVAKVRPQRCAGHGQRIHADGMRLFQLMTIEVKAVERDQRCRMPGRPRAGRLQQGQGLVRQVTQ